MGLEHRRVRRALRPISLGHQVASIQIASLPEEALLRRYREQDRNYTDCYTTLVAGRHVLSDFVYAFYTTWLFKLERLIIKHLAHRPSTDAQARRLADGSGTAFAVWTVEARNDAQLLLCDHREKTRSWLMVEAVDDSQTLLRFGSAVVATADGTAEAPEIGTGFRWLLGFHKLYSRALLYCARTRLQRLAPLP